MIRFLASSIKSCTVFLFGATGEIINQKAGHLNMGTPGIMGLGAVGGLVGERIYIASIPATASLNPFMILFMPILFALLFGAIGGLLFSFFTVTLHCNQNVTGLTLTTFGVGLAGFLTNSSIIPADRMTDVNTMIQNAFSWYGKLGWFGEIFLSQSWFTYIGIIVAIVVAIVIAKTKVGLRLRAVGENAAAADSDGINVNRYRYLATIIGGAISGVGGAFYVLDEVYVWISGDIDDIAALGWLALCIVIFSMWKPIIAIFASFGFACLKQLPMILGTLGYFKGHGYMSYVFDIIPYVATITVLVITSILSSKKNQPPANLGQSYFREDR